MKLSFNITHQNIYALIVEQGDNDNELYAHGYVFIKRKDNITLQKTLGKTKFHDLLDAIEKNAGVVIHLTGKNVLTRIEGYSQKDLFPELDDDQFYRYRYQDDSWNVESVIRKELTDTIIEKIKLNHFLLNVSFGPGSLFNLSEVLDNDDYRSDGHKISITDNLITAIEKAESAQNIVTVEEISIPEDDLVILGNLIGYFSDGLNSKIDLSEQKSQAYYFHKSKILGMFSLITVFTLLLINFFLYSYFDNSLKVNHLEGESLRQKVDRINYLNDQIKEYNSIFLGGNAGIENVFSMYLDQIAGKRPKSIHLRSIWVNPELKKKAVESQLLYDIGVITIEGQAQNPVEFNRFIRALNKLSWIKDIEVSRYEKDNAKSWDNFELKIMAG